jgi:hypothetical protein
MSSKATDIRLAAGPVYLLVGLDTLPSGAAAARDTGWTVHRADFHGVDARLLSALRPERIACPLLAPRFDAEQLAQRLDALGFTGRLTVVAPGLPDRQMVARELSATAPAMTIEVVPD